MLFDRIKETGKKFNLNVKEITIKAGIGENAGCRHFSCLCISVWNCFVPFLSPLAGKSRSVQKQVIKSCPNGFFVAEDLVHKNKPPAITGRRHFCYLIYRLSPG